MPQNDTIRGYRQVEFAAADLANSFPFDWNRTLRGPSSQSLMADTIAKLRTCYPRKRGQKASDGERYEATVSVILANLLAGALNRVDGSRFAAVSLDKNSFADTGRSYLATRHMRDMMLELGWIEGTCGFIDREPDWGRASGRRTRIRATASLRHVFSDYGVDRKSLSIASDRLIRLKKPHVAKSAEPTEISDSRSLLIGINSSLASASISLPDDAWEQLKVGRFTDIGEDNDAVARYRRYAGDLSAVSLYRVFNGDYLHGGRLYGGWWMSIPGELRPDILIDGEPTIELDYAHLHPRLLFNRTGPMTVHPYQIPGLDSPAHRKLAKRTFNRLLNTVTRAGQERAKIRAQKDDKPALPANMKFQTYLLRFRSHLKDIDQYFGTGEGLRLQREDSDLAIGVLSKLHVKGIVALPVHDSFIVKAVYHSDLRDAMASTYRDRYGNSPVIKP